MKQKSIVFIFLSLLLVGTLFLKKRQVDEAYKLQAPLKATSESLQPTVESTLPMDESQKSQSGIFALHHPAQEIPNTKSQTQHQSNRQSDLIENIRAKTLKVISSPNDRRELKDLLLSEQTTKVLQELLVDDSLLYPKQFRKRLHALDLLYEGLKFSDPMVRTAYLEIANRFISRAPSNEVLTNKTLATQFQGDRVELALIMMTLDRSHQTNFENELKSKSSGAKTYFKKAKLLSKIYQVAI